jgi:hypothetical protein
MSLRAQAWLPICTSASIIPLENKKRCAIAKEAAELFNGIFSLLENIHRQQITDAETILFRPISVLQQELTARQALAMTALLKMQCYFNHERWKNTQVAEHLEQQRLQAAFPQTPQIAWQGPQAPVSKVLPVPSIDEVAAAPLARWIDYLNGQSRLHTPSYESAIAVQIALSSSSPANYQEGIKALNIPQKSKNKLLLPPIVSLDALLSSWDLARFSSKPVSPQVVATMKAHLQQILPK